jgi:hypothetical protein
MIASAIDDDNEQDVVILRLGRGEETWFPQADGGWLERG